MLPKHSHILARFIFFSNVLQYTMSSANDDATVTFRWDRDKVQRLDNIIVEKKYEGKLDTDTSRSDVIKGVLDDYLQEADC